MIALARRVARALRACLPRPGGASRTAPAPVLVVCDVENIAISARQAGAAICFSRLHDHLARRLGATDLHAVYSHDPASSIPHRALAASPWTLHTRSPTWARRDGLWKKHANADTLFATTATRLTAALRPRRVLLLTGDDDLTADTAAAIVGTTPGIPDIRTTGIRGTVARRITDGQSYPTHRYVSVGAQVTRRERRCASSR